MKDINGFPIYELNDDEARVLIAALDVPPFTWDGQVDSELANRDRSRTQSHIARRAEMSVEEVGVILRSLSLEKDPLVYAYEGRYISETIWLVLCAGADALDGYQMEKGIEWPNEQEIKLREHQSLMKAVEDLVTDRSK